MVRGGTHYWKRAGGLISRSWYESGIENWNWELGIGSGRWRCLCLWSHGLAWTRLRLFVLRGHLKEALGGKAFRQGSLSNAPKGKV